MRLFEASPVSDLAYGLAEGPVWDAGRQRVLWVDVNAGTVHRGRLAGGGITEEWRKAVDTTVGAVVASSGGDLLVAGARSLFVIATDGSVQRGTEIIPAAKASRLNDGGCDPRGRFLVGTLALGEHRDDEFLVRVDATGAITALDGDLSLSNGLAFAPDGGTLYSIDTTPGTLWQRTYNAETGDVGPRAHLLHVDGGHPDGLCTDSDGNLWIAIWGAGEVRCFSPGGRHLATVAVTAPNTSSVAFIGPNLDTLLITTASEQLSAEDRAGHPDSGRLFIAEVGATGAPVHPWAGPWR